MSKLSDNEKREIYTDFVSGKSKTEIAKKFNISVTAVSKILNKDESLKNSKKFNLSSAQMRTDIITKATGALWEKDFSKLHPETLLKIIERLSMLKTKSDEGEEEKSTTISFVFKDTSGGGKNGDSNS